MRIRGSVCRIVRCKRRPSVDGLCKTHAVQECDRLFSLAVRSVGRCQYPDGSHAGNLQCAHGFSRSYKAVRWERANAWSLCAGHHTYFTHRPLEWDSFMLDWLGVTAYTALRGRALTHIAPDLDVVLADLRAAA